MDTGSDRKVDWTTRVGAEDRDFELSRRERETDAMFAVGLDLEVRVGSEG